MPTRDDIIYGIRDYSAQQILDFIINGLITIPEILDENAAEFSLSLRNEVEKALWDYTTEAGSVRACNLYLENYPQQDNANHTTEALRLKESLLQPVPPPVIPKVNNEPAAIEEEDTSFETTPETGNDPWDLVDLNSIDSLEEFRENYPDHPKYIEAGRLIHSLEEGEYLPKGPEWLKEQLSKVGANDQADLIIEAYKHRQITSQELIDLLKEDHNFINQKVVTDILGAGILTSRDLKKAGIHDDFINVIKGSYVGLVNNKVDTANMENPEFISEGRQEIYFWGIPASGKTCALGAILSAASSGEVANSLNPLISCKGYAYLNQLRGTFVPGKISELPSGTNEDFVADMSFDLIDKKKKAHSITLIDIAGELLDTMRRMDENDMLNVSENAMKGYQTMINLLVNRSSKNSKIHFFVVEYGGHDREHKGMKQADLLDAALTHIHAKGVLRNSDAVYILMTKADMAFNQPGDINEILERYLFTHYQGFYNRLKAMTEENSIHRLGFIPFSIGEVCFKKLCRFDATTANNVVDTFIEDTRGSGTSKRDKWFGSLRN